MPDVMVLYNVVMVWIYLCPNNGVVHCPLKIGNAYLQCERVRVCMVVGLLYSRW